MLKKAALVVLLGLATGALAAEFPLEMGKLSDQDYLADPNSMGAFGQLTSVKPQTLAKEPPAVSDRPLYGSVIMGEGAGLAFRLDESQGKGKGYDRLIIDLNGNGDLTDDPAGKAMKEEKTESSPYEMVYIGPIEASAMKRGPWIPTLYAQAMIYDRRMTTATRGNVGYIRVRDVSYLKATVVVNAVKQSIAIFDANCNLRLGDKAELVAFKTPEGEALNLGGGDMILRDRTGAGKFNLALAGKAIEPLSNLFYVGPEPCSLKLAADLKTVTLEPYTEALGELQVKNGDKLAALVLGRQTNGRAWEPVAPDVADGKAKVPAGSYQLYSCVLAGKAAGGAELLAVGMNAAAKLFKVAKGETATLICGAPVELKVNAQKQAGSSGGFLGALVSGGSKTVAINASIVGAGGEAYRTFARSDGAEVKAPQFKVLDAKGKEVVSGQLEFG